MPRSNVARLRPVAMPVTAPYDWQPDEDGPLTELDVNVLMAWCDTSTTQAVRDAARKTLHFIHTHGGPKP